MSTYKRDIIRNQAINESCLENPIIRIVQWNIFAQGFVVADNYQYCKPEDLTLENRKLLFKKEFECFNADIYCFQEADIHKDLLGILNNGNKEYDEIFVEKKKSPCLLYPNNYGPDGCSIVYKTKKFQCLQNLVIDFEEIGQYRCLFSVFSPKSNPDIKFIIACTHLKSKKQYEDWRLKQCEYLLSNLNDLMEKWSTTNAFICGDFNASPNEKAIKNVQNSHLNLVNVYEELKTDSNENRYYTTWSFRKNLSATKRITSQLSSSLIDSHEHMDAIDYIWYTKPLDFSNKIHNFRILPLSIIDVPSKEEIGIYGLPSDKYPSDHLSLIADFIIENII